MLRANLLAAFCFGACLMFARDSDSDVAQQAQQAKRAMLAHRYSEAVDIYKKMVVAGPQEPEIRFNLALALHSAGRYREAVHELEMLRRSEQQNPSFWFLLGLGYLKLDEPQKAIEPLRRTTSLNPSDLEAGLELADAYLESSQFKTAQIRFGELSREHPELPKVWEGLALSELGLSHEAFEALTKQAPASSFRYGLAAVAESESGNTKKAVELYRRALAAEPMAPWINAELARLENPSDSDSGKQCNDTSLACEFSRGEWIRLTEETAKLRTSEGLYWTCRAYAQLAKQSMATLAALPPSAEQHEMLARAHAQAGQRTEAIAELREAARLSPTDSLIQSDLARALWFDRKYEEAIPILEALLGSNPGQPRWEFELGDALLSLGKPEEAAGHLYKAVSRAPNLLPAQAKLGEALLQMGEVRKAVPHLELAQVIDQDGSIHFQLATAYRRLGRMELARRAMARQQELQTAAAATQP